MAIGTESSIVHRVVDAVMGSCTIRHETIVSEYSATPASISASLGGSDACGVHSKLIVTATTRAKDPYLLSQGNYSCYHYNNKNNRKCGAATLSSAKILLFLHGYLRFPIQYG